MKKLVPISMLLVIFSLWLIGKVDAVTLVNENFDSRTFSSAINVMTTYPSYCTGTGCAYGTISHNSNGYSLQGSHDVSGYNMIVAFSQDPITYFNAGCYIRYWVYFPSSYQFAAECGSSYNNQKIMKFAGSSGDPDIEIIFADCQGLLAGSTSEIGIVKLQYTTESNGTFGLEGYNIASGHFIKKDQWNKIEAYIYIPSSGSRNSTIRLTVNDSTAFNLTNQPINKGSYSGTKQLVSVRMTGGGSCMPSSGHGTWYLDDLKIVYGEGDLTGKDGTSKPPSPPTGLKIVN